MISYNTNNNPCSTTYCVRDKKLVVSLQSILFFLFGFQFFISNLAKHSSLYRVSAILLIFTSCFYLPIRRKILISKYYVISILFIAYNIILVYLGDVASFSHSISMIKTISFNLVLYVVTYSFFVDQADSDKILKVYVKSSFLSCLAILFVYRESLFTGRLGSSWFDNANTYSLFNWVFQTAGSNGIAFFSSVAFIFTIYLFKKYKSKKYLVYNLVFITTILATGSRKGFFIFAAGYFLSIIILNKKSKKVIYGFLSVLVAYAAYYTTQTVSFLYDVIGSRLNELLGLILFGIETSDASINTRLRLIDIAIELFKENPVWGYGLDAFRIIGPWGIVTDNNYLDILVSSGSIGFLIYYSFVVLVIWDYFTLKNKPDLVKILFSVFLLILIMEYGSVTYFERNVGIVYLLVFSIFKIERKKLKLFNRNRILE